MGTQDQEVEFRNALHPKEGVVLMLYASPATAVVRLEDVPDSAESSGPYQNSAWCMAETAVSTMGNKPCPGTPFVSRQTKQGNLFALQSPPRTTMRWLKAVN